MNLSDMEMGVRRAPLERVSAVKINRHGYENLLSSQLATSKKPICGQIFWSNLQGLKIPRMSLINPESGLYEEKHQNRIFEDFFDNS
jgi:hypothetical protein